MTSHDSRTTPVVALVALTVALVAACASKPAGEWKVYTSADGLAADWVRAFTIDATGAVWFATNKGTSRFDGTTWKTFTTADGLANDNVYVVMVDGQGTVWFGTKGGVSRYDGEAWMSYGKDDGLAADWITSIEPTPEGSIWFGTRLAGLTVRDADGAFKNYSSLDGIPHDAILSMAWDAEANRLYVGADGGGLTYFGGEMWVTHREEDQMPGQSFTGMVLDGKGGIWLGSAKGGAAHFSGAGKAAFERFTRDRGLGSNAIQCVALGPDGTVWFGTDKGAASYDGDGWRQYTLESGLPSESVTAITVAGDGTVWFGTVKGVASFRPAPKV